MAVLRPQYEVRTINAKMQFLNEKGKPKGDEFDRSVFEEEYKNPVTKQTHPGGTITVFVEANVPKGYAVDYWKINSVPHYFNRTVSSFTVHDLDETTVYEVVLRKASASASTPKPASKPAVVCMPYYPAYEPSEPEPVEKYRATCKTVRSRAAVIPALPAAPYRLAQP